jgi:hypothetical protein
MIQKIRMCPSKRESLHDECSNSEIGTDGESG